MANWCENILTVKPKNILTNIFTQYVCKTDTSKNNFFDFQKIIPIDISDQNENWYKECYEKWGTKWCPDNIICNDSYLSFATAWTPPIPIVRKLAELYPDAQFTLEYNEPEMEIHGIYSIKTEEGRVIEDNTHWEKIIEKMSELYQSISDYFKHNKEADNNERKQYQVDN
jgi:hypothetical protein